MKIGICRTAYTRLILFSLQTTSIVPAPDKNASISGRVQPFDGSMPVRYRMAGGCSAAGGPS